MEKLSLENIKETIKNMEIIMNRVSEVVEEIGFLTSEFDTLDIEKTEFDDKKVYVTAYDSHYDMYDSESGSFPIEFFLALLLFFDTSPGVFQQIQLKIQ